MAKGLRSKSKQANKSKLRQNVYGPVESRRAERLSAKLLEIVAQAKPLRNTSESMELETGNGRTPEFALTKARDEKSGKSVNILEDAMDLDIRPAEKVARAAAASTKVQKRGKKKVPRKERNSIVFKSVRRRELNRRREAKRA